MRGRLPPADRGSAWSGSALRSWELAPWLASETPGATCNSRVCPARWRPYSAAQNSGTPHHVKATTPRGLARLHPIGGLHGASAPRRARPAPDRRPWYLHTGLAPCRDPHGERSGAVSWTESSEGSGHPEAGEGAP